jgi:hypothetical protein
MKGGGREGEGEEGKCRREWGCRELEVSAQHAIGPLTREPNGALSN